MKNESKIGKWVRTKEHRDALGQRMLGTKRPHKEETKIKIGNANRGKKKVLSVEHRAKCAAALRRRTDYSVKEETKEKLRIINTGKKHSAETRFKMSIVHKNRLNGDNYYKNMPDCIVCQKHLTSYRAKYCTNHKGIQNRGEKNKLWKGGITKESAAIRSSTVYKKWRKAVFERDKYTCIFCKSKSGKGKIVILNADHIKPFAYFPELRLSVDNGRTLCFECHKKTDTWMNGAKKIYGKNK